MYGKDYNEVIVSSDAWIEQLPHSVEAFFVVECGSGPDSQRCIEGQASTRRTHRDFLRKYGLSERDTPLVQIRPRRWDAPFELASD